MQFYKMQTNSEWEKIHHWFPRGEGREAMVYRYVCPVTQSWQTLWGPMDCSPPGFSVHGISQAIILEGVAVSFSRGSPQHRDQPWVSWVPCIARWMLYPGKPHVCAAHLDPKEHRKTFGDYGYIHHPDHEYGYIHHPGFMNKSEVIKLYIYIAYYTSIISQ